MCIPHTCSLSPGEALIKCLPQRRPLTMRYCRVGSWCSVADFHHWTYHPGSNPIWGQLGGGSNPRSTWPQKLLRDCFLWALPLEKHEARTPREMMEALKCALVTLEIGMRELQEKQPDSCHIQPFHHLELYNYKKRNNVSCHTYGPTLVAALPVLLHYWICLRNATVARPIGPKSLAAYMEVAQREQ